MTNGVRGREAWRIAAHATRRHCEPAGTGVSDGDRRLIAEALAAGRVTACPPAPAWTGGAFSILGREGGLELSETAALLRVERSA